MGPRARAPRWIKVATAADPRPHYLRFVCFELVEGQRNRLGLFQAIDLARESEQAPGWALALIEDVNDWFADHLTAPPVFDRRRHPDAQDGLCWFKPEAIEQITRMYALKTGLEACGVHVEVLRSRSPGVIVWEDEHQVVATPGGRRF